jgi:hypothetical protein
MLNRGRNIRKIAWRRVFLLFILNILSCSSLLLGQSAGNEEPCVEQLPFEELSLFCDRDYYLAGDRLWFKAFVLLDGKLSDTWSKVLYLELFNANKEVALQEKYAIENGMVSGEVLLPADVPTGHYFLRAYTQYARNFSSESYFSKVLSIVNPEDQGEVIELSLEEAPDPYSNVSQPSRPKAQKIDLALNKKTFHRREMVSLELGTEKLSHLALVVRKKGTAHSLSEKQYFYSRNPWLNDRAFGGYEDLVKQPEFSPDGLKLIPELRSLSLSGKLKEKESGKALAGQSCIAAIIGNERQIHLSRSNEKGEFIFPFEDLYDEQDVYVSLRGQANSPVEILVNKDFSGDFPDLKPMLFDTSKHQLFEGLYLNQQIQQKFSPLKKQSYYAPAREDRATFNIGVPDYEIRLKDFIALNSLPDVFRELVPTVSVRGNIGARRLSVFEKEINRSHDDPLVLLDNVPVADLEALMQLNPEFITSIEVYDTEYQLGDFSFGGIVAINTATDNFAGYKWTDSSVFLSYKTLRDSKVFQMPIYDSEEAKKDRRPDFRTVLYWNPDVTLNGKDEKITFYTSDHRAAYEIVLFGYTKDGQWLYGKEEIEVVE